MQTTDVCAFFSSDWLNIQNLMPVFCFISTLHAKPKRFIRFGEKCCLLDILFHTILSSSFLRNKLLEQTDPRFNLAASPVSITRLALTDCSISTALDGADGSISEIWAYLKAALLCSGGTSLQMQILIRASISVCECSSWVQEGRRWKSCYWVTSALLLPCFICSWWFWLIVVN